MAAEHPPCSVVLEGGVTSAVVYATLLARLSKRYSFRQLGGTSSGAVAAAAAAAAEFGRRHADEPSHDGFATLAAFPNTLAQTDEWGDTVLFRLFQPRPPGRASFRVAMAALDRSGTDSAKGSAARAALSLAQHFWGMALVLALVGAMLGATLLRWMHNSVNCKPLVIDSLLGCTALGALMLLPVVLGLWLILAAWALRATVRALRGNHWGLCSGMEQPGHHVPALTTTLHKLLQDLSGRPGGPLLCFGDLWWGPKVNGMWEKTDERQIDLQVITTAVSLQRPVRLPGAPDDNPLHPFFYDPQEWQAFFPATVMAHLARHRRPVTLQRDATTTLWALPDPEHWPVLMTVRLSLSFPLLMSALPMYVALPRREVLRGGAAAGQPPFEARRVYFSDGGITSNCPVHLFDAPLPRFPTFGVNLYRLPRGSRPRVLRSDSRIPEMEVPPPQGGASDATPLPFLLDMLWTALDWRDSLQRRMPGCRERMVHVGLPADAGGLHLAMKPQTIRRLARLGGLAAAVLVRHFATPRSAGQPNAWDRHRWTRARISLSALRRHLHSFVDRLGAGTPRYDELLRTATPSEYPFDSELARQQALELAQRSRALMDTLEATPPADAMDRHSPEPRPELHLSPPW